MAQLIHGYKVGYNRYVALTDDDFAGVPLKSLHTIELGQFVPLSAIDPILFTHTYYLAPEQLGTKPFVW